MPVCFAKSSRILILGASLAFGAVSATNAAEYKIDPAHSFILFKTGHLGFSWLTGRFNDFEGSFNYDPEAGPEAQSITLTIDAASLDTNHAERDKDLRSARFFNVEEHPTITFESTNFEGDESGGTMTGNLTFLGVTKEVSFPVRKIGEGKDPWGGYRTGFEGSYTLARSEFGMKEDLGPSAEEVELTLLIEGIRQ